MFDRFAALKDNALHHLDTAVTYARDNGRAAVATQLESGRKDLAQSRYNIAIVGDMKRGKSTLLNVLLGRSDDRLSPIRASICTSAIVHFASREAHPEGLSEAQVFIEEQSEPMRVPVEAVEEYITEKHNPANFKKVRSVDVYGDFPLLRNVVTLVDTPGRGSKYGHHDILVEQFMPLADAIIFLISTDLPVTADERQFLDQLSQMEKEKIFFVLTKRDEVADKDIPEVRRWVMKNISDAGLKCDRLFEVSAKRVFDALCAEADAEQLQRMRRESGIAALEAELESFIVARSSKNAALLPRLRGLLDYLGQFCASAAVETEQEIALLDEDSEKIDGELKTLRYQASVLKSDCEKSLGKFRRGWMKAVAEFRRSLEARSQTVSDRVLDRGSRGGLFAAATSSFKIRKVVGESLRMEADVLLPALDEKLAKETEKLDNDLATDWQTYARSRPGRDLIAPGAAVLGVGGSAAMIGNAYALTAAALGQWTSAAATPGWAGVWPAIKLYFGGIPAAKTVAVGAAYTATTPAVIAVGVSIATCWIAKQVILAVQENRVPELVRSTMEEMCEGIEKTLAGKCDEIIELYREQTAEQLAHNESRLEEIEQAVKTRDPQAKVGLVARLEQARRLLQEQRDLAHSLILYLPPANP